MNTVTAFSPDLSRQIRASRAEPQIPTMYLVMEDFGHRAGSIARGCEAIVDPEQTRRDVIDRLVHGDYRHIRFILEICDGVPPRDVTLELQMEASAIAEAA